MAPLSATMRAPVMSGDGGDDPRADVKGGSLSKTCGASPANIAPRTGGPGVEGGWEENPLPQGARRQKTASLHGIASRDDVDKPSLAKKNSKSSYDDIKVNSHPFPLK